MNEEILALIRHGLTTAGGGLIASGAVTGSQWQDVIGGLMALGAIAWSLYQKRQQRAAVAVALATPVPFRP